MKRGKSRTKYPSYGGRFHTKQEAQKKAALRRRYGYAVKIVPDNVIFEGKTHRGYKLMESLRPTRHTWWKEHLMGESVAEYKGRMKRKGLRAYTK